MTKDNLIVLFAFVIYWVTLIGLTLLCEQKLLVFLINLIVHVSYSSYFLWNLYYKPSGWKNTLGAWIGLLGFIGVHWVLDLIYLILIVVL